MTITGEQVRAARKLLGWSSVKTGRPIECRGKSGRWSVYVRFTTQAALAFPDWPLSRAAISVAGTALLNKYP
jgi:hypothetical protein